jgi:hypothetical protein
MKRVVVSALLFFASILCGYESRDPILVEAHSYYKGGSLQKAVDLYQRLEEKDEVIHFNIGNCFYKLDDKGRALLHWRIAEKKWGILGRGELLENIRLLKGYGSQKGLSGFFQDIRIYLGSYARSFPLFLLQILFLVFWLFLFFFLGGKAKRGPALVSIIILLLFSTVFFIGIHYYFGCSKKGVVIKKEAPLLSGPSKTFQELGSLQAQDEVCIVGKSEGYFKVKMSDIKGWILKENIGKIYE